MLILCNQTYHAQGNRTHLFHPSHLTCVWWGRAETVPWTHLLCGVLIGIVHVLLLLLVLFLFQCFAYEASHLTLCPWLLSSNQEPFFFFFKDSATCWCPVKQNTLHVARKYHTAASVMFCSHHWIMQILEWSLSLTEACVYISFGYEKTLTCHPTLRLFKFSFM